MRKVSKFTISKEERKHIYVLYIRSILEQSCVVWHSSLTQENSDDLERVQKAAVRIILGKKYPENYEQALVRADLELLKERRVQLCKEFAKKCLQNERTDHIFKKNKVKHKMKTKKSNIYKIKHANTKRFQNSAIIYMQNLLNSRKRYC